MPTDAAAPASSFSASTTSGRRRNSAEGLIVTSGAVADGMGAG